MHHHTDPALDSELAYRRNGLHRAAADHRLARLARGARTGRRGAGTDAHRSAR